MSRRAPDRIISASRRTDIPAWHAPWFMNRIRAGSVLTANPFRPSQIREVSLAPEDVDAIVFWTRNPAPLMPHLDELEERGFNYLFLFTITGYGMDIEPGVPPLERQLELFSELVDRVGEQRVIWRYDPIIVGEGRFSPPAHLERFGRIARSLRTRRESLVIMSLLDTYRKTLRNLRPWLSDRCEEQIQLPEPGSEEVLTLATGLADLAAGEGRRAQHCCEPAWSPLMKSGACINGATLAEVFDLADIGSTDPGQREDCRCAPARDIGSPGTCAGGCLYCYANRKPLLPEHLSSLDQRRNLL